MTVPFEILDWLPTAEIKQKAQILDYLETAPIASDHWKIIKKLYKTYEQEFEVNITPAIIEVIDAIDISKCTSNHPKKETVRYMKRRARRFLKKLEEPTLYYQVASQLLSRLEKNKKLNLDNQWIIQDILYGKSKRKTVKSFGACTINTAKYHLNEPEERRPEVWDNHLDFVKELFYKNMPTEIYEFCAKILIRNKHQVLLRPEILPAFFHSNNILLQRLAKDFVVAELSRRSSVTPQAIAGAVVYASAQDQKNLFHIALENLQIDLHKEEFVAELMKLAIPVLKTGKISPRVVRAVAFVVKNYKNYLKLSPADILPIAKSLFHSNNPDLEELAFSAAKDMDVRDALMWLDAINAKNNAQITRITEILKLKYGNKKIYPYEMEKFIFYPSTTVCGFGWFLAKNNMQKHYDITSIFYTIGYRFEAEPHVLINSITNDICVELFVAHYDKNKTAITYLNHQILVFMMKNGLPTMVDLIEKSIKIAYQNTPLSYLALLSKCPDAYREKVFNETLKSLTKRNVFGNEIYTIPALVAGEYDYKTTQYIAPNAWLLEKLFILADTCILTEDNINYLFSMILIVEDEASNHYKKQHNVVLNWILRFTEDEKRELFLKCLTTSVGDNPQILTILPANLVKMMLDRLSVDNLVHFITNLDDATWASARTQIVAKLAQNSDNVALWKSIMENISANTDNENLQKRTFSDKDVLALFFSCKNPEILDIKLHQWDNLLFEWVSKNAILVTPNSMVLYKISTHTLPKIRNYGLETVKKMATNKDVSVPFGLSLIESDIPPTVEVAKEFFESLPESSIKEFDSVLALCDSPNANVRKFGLDYLKKRKANLVLEKDQHLEFLSEHSDAQILRVVAEEITYNNVDKPFVERFDKEILRTKYRNRKAKNNIKARIDKTLLINPSVLMEMARSTSKKDAEWAILQLTKMTIAGTNVTDFQVK